MSKEFKSDEDIKKFISEKPLKKILLLSGENSFNKTGAKKIFKEYLKKNEFKIFLKKKKLPEIDELEKIIETVGNFRPDLIIAIGGGCVMDLAKISSVINNSKNIKEDVINSNFIENKIKVLAIPTTAGSGAEVTSNAVIYLNKIKYSVEGPSVRPDYFFLKPELILSSNFYLDATACFDAISQSVESLFSINSNDESIMFAKKGLEILFGNFKDYFKNKSIQNSYKMLIGANFSGKAINISKTIAPHALSYPFTTLYGIPHGHAVSLTFNEILNFNFLNMNRSKNPTDLKLKYEILFNLTKTNNIEGLNNYFIKLKQDLGLEQDHKKLNINLISDKEKFFSGINSQRLKNNPIEIAKDDLEKIFKIQ